MANKKTTKTANYDVGYARPPESTRFKPGQTGNPKGRPRGSKNFGTQVRKIADEKVEVRDARGRLRKMSKLEVATTQVINKAAAGDLPAYRLVMALIQQADVDTGEKKSALDGIDTRALLANFIADIQGDGATAAQSPAPKPRARKRKGGAL